MKLPNAILVLLLGLAPSAALSQGASAAAGAASKPDLTRYPLDPLTKDEIQLASKVLKDSNQVSHRAIFTYIGLKEPKKEDVLSYKRGDPFERRAKCVIFEPASGRR